MFLSIISHRYLLFVLLTTILAASANVDKDEWFVVSPPGVGASVEMPRIPAFNQQRMQPVRDEAEILVRTRSAVINKGNANLTFVYHDENKTPAGRHKIQKVLDGAVTGAVALVNGEVISQREIFLGSHKGRDVVYSCEIEDVKLQKTHDLKIRTQVILVGRRLYSLNYISVISEYDQNIADRFFESFQLVRATTDLPPKPRAGRARQLAQEEPDPEIPIAKPSQPLTPNSPPGAEAESATENDEPEATIGGDSIGGSDGRN